MSRYWTAGDVDGYWATLANGLRMITVLVIPATLGLAVLSWPSVQLLFQHGATDRDGAVQILVALLVYLPGTLFAAYDQALIFAYYARQNTKTPQTVGVLAVGVYLVVALSLVRPFGMAGLVAANSAQFVFHTIVMLMLVRRLFPDGTSAAGHFDVPRVLRTLRVCTVAGLMMAGVAGTFALLLARGLPEASGGAGTLLRELIVIGIPAAMGALIYAAALLIYRVEEMHMIQRRLLAAVGR
jgi:putative peptidoglycan lipid II flippase